MKDNPSFFAPRVAWVTALLVIFIFGFAIRLYDLTDLPLDFHPTRQLLSALKARGMYYQTLSAADIPAEQRAFAIQQWRFRASVEPEFFERIIAFTYKFTGEQVWIARIYSSLFWMIGAVFLFLLARDITSTDGALAATAFYLFSPYAILASRSFQPDPLMVMLIIIFLWAVYQWAQRPASYFYAILAGLFGGFAIFIKLVAAFFVIGGGVGALLGRGSLREALKQPQVYVMSLLGILPGAVYVLYGVFIAGYLGRQFGGRFIPALFLSPSYYLGWIGMLNLVIGGFVFMTALLGLFFLDREKRRFLLSLWAGYAFFGIYFNYHISSHDYYSLPLIPIVALSIAPLADWFFVQLAKIAVTRLMRFAVIGLLLLGSFMSLWSTRSQMKSVDYRPDAQMWAEIGEKIGDKNSVGLTQDYGSRLAYWGWKNISSWPTHGDLIYHNDLRGAHDGRDFEKQFEELALKKKLFLVTDFSDLALQPFLQEKLLEYPVFAKGNGYVIYDISQ
ncbi:glycosyltransferase family 39 protein [Candidatus Villigracilis saccharophilus]|uniref:ArnT family glycosyltransferase n=1 Tax=Candidatus Villigracilis saccharophilus TaxID=3140684 RepID=UPI00313548D3|nr:glycosyltransferase family 39 protein [Anaerolineales bacterium]